MSRPELTRLRVLGFTISVCIAGLFELQNTNAQDRNAELSVTIVCVDIESSTYQEMQENLESVAQARNCQRGGLPRHELTGVFGTSEIRKLINSLVDAQKANVCWFHQAKIRSNRGIDVPTGPWTISRSGTNFVAWQGNIELYRGEAAPELESVGIRQGMQSADRGLVVEAFPVSTVAPALISSTSDRARQL